MQRQRSNTLRPDPSQTTLESGPTLFGHQIQRSDLHRMLCIDDGPKMYFSEVDYRLLLLFFQQQQAAPQTEVSYTTIAREIYRCEVDEYLLPPLRKRVSALRKEIADFGLDIVNIPHHGYMVRDLTDHALPYRRGYRAHVRRQRQAAPK